MADLDFLFVASSEFNTTYIFENVILLTQTAFDLVFDLDVFDLGRRFRTTFFI